MTRTLALLAALALAATSNAAPPPGGGPPPPMTADEASPDLREALRAFYVRSLTQELELSPAQAERLQPRIDALLDAQRDALRSRARAAAGVMSAARLALDAQGAERESAAAAVTAAERSEREALERLNGARSRLLEELTPRQGARLLAFEDVFARRVRALAAARRSGGEPPPEQGEERENGRPEPEPDGGDQRDEWLRTAMIVFTHEARTQLELTDAATLQLLPRMETLFRARMDGERQRRRMHADLRAAAEDPATPDAELKSKVEQARRFESEQPARAAEARHAILATLSPVQAARFLLLEHRAERQLRDLGRHARELRTMGTRPGGMGPEGAGPPRGGWPRRPGGQRDRGRFLPRR